MLESSNTEFDLVQNQWLEFFSVILNIQQSD